MYQSHPYLPVLSLHGQLFEVYTRQVRTISGPALHHVAMAHPKYLNWATMVTHYMSTISGCTWLAKEWKRLIPQSLSKFLGGL